MKNVGPLELRQQDVGGEGRKSAASELRLEKKNDVDKLRRTRESSGE
jgi:hypothetical protein